MSDEHPRFRVHAYVDEDGAHPATIEGWALFGDIYSQAPESARYAVVEDTAGEFVVWEFHRVYGASLALRIYGTSLALRKRPPDDAEKWRGPSCDAMVMKVLALYGR